MKFFFQCAAFFIVLAGVLIVLDQIIFGRLLSASFLYALVLSIAGSVIFGWILETHINHKQNFTKNSPPFNEKR
ncbi:MAG TPA: hypothetical protein VK106_06900 [Balneolaceae bacterium]|nr:hypothetical protein [Balneolaceae bacterium]